MKSDSPADVIENVEQGNGKPPQSESVYGAECLESAPEDAMRTDFEAFVSSDGYINEDGNGYHSCEESGDEFGMEGEEDACQSSNNKSNIENLFAKEDMGSDDFFSSMNDESIHPSLHCKTSDAILMILEFFLHHHLTWTALEDLLQMFHSMLGYQSTLPKTKYLFKKLFGTNQENVFHFYCQNCNLYIDTLENLKIELALDKSGENNLNCPNCQHKFSLQKMNNGHFFIQLPLKEQIKNKIVKNPEILDFDTTPSPNDSIRDFYDGALYKNLRQKVGDGKLVTLTINTDGVKVFKSTAKTSLWPIQMFINEVPVGQRFKIGNIILNGVWFGKSPNFALYLKHLISELDNLDKEKIQVNINNSCYEVTIRVLLVSADTPARCKVLMLKQFNGKFGCTYCLHPGDRLNGSKTSKYLVGDYLCRTHSGTLALMAEFLKTGKGTYGVKGLSPLIAIKDYDLIRGTVIDYMHCVLLGVVFLLLDLWFESKNHMYDYYISPTRAQVVIKNLLNIQSLKSFSHRPRSIDDRNDWKANELRNWLLYYALPCLKDTLNDAYYRHFSLLVEAIYIFLKTNISATEFKKGSENLKTFVHRFQILYDPENMMYNVHLLEHLPQCVKDCGPLWAYSNFNFESNNGSLVKNVKGTTDVQKQIVTKYFYNKALESLKEHNETARNYINEIRSNKVKNSKKIGLITLFGTPRNKKLNPSEQSILQKTNILEYNKLFFSNDLFYSTSYKKCEKTNDTVVSLKDGSFGQITRIYEDAGIVYILLKKFRVQKVPSFFPVHLKKVEFGDLVRARADEISEKCILINTLKETYLSCLPNRVESD